MNYSESEGNASEICAVGHLFHNSYLQENVTLCSHTGEERGRGRGYYVDKLFCLIWDTSQISTQTILVRG